MKKVIYILLSVLVFSGCKKEITDDNRKEESTYSIINLLINDYKKESVLRIVLPSFDTPYAKEYYKNFSLKDSLFAYKYFYDQVSKKKIIAINKKTFHFNEYKVHSDDCKEFKDNSKLISELVVNKEIQEIDLKKLFLHKKRNEFKQDSLIYYSEKIKKLPRKGFDKIDVLFSFSNITFNKKYNKAIVVVGVSFGKLNGFSTLIYLEKKHFHWEVKCEEVLSIS